MLRTCYGHGLTKGAIIQILYHGLDVPTQRILDVRGIFLYKTRNEAFKILEDKVLLKLDFSDGSQNSKPKTVVSAGGINFDSSHTILVDKFKALAIKIDSDFLVIRKELKEMRDGRRDNHVSQIYMKDDTLMCEPHEANYVQVRHEFVYKSPSIQKENDKGDVKSIEEDVINHVSTMPNPNLINSNSPIVSSFLKDCNVHIPYMNAKTFANDVLLNHVGNEELKSVDGVGTGRMTKKGGMGMPHEPHGGWKLKENMVPYNEEVYCYLQHPTEIPHLNSDNGGGCLEVKSIDLTRLCQLLDNIYHTEFNRDFSCPDVWFSLTLISLFYALIHFVALRAMLKLSLGEGVNRENETDF
ncbi:hypothetical protein Tco_1039789 [Tanacetum coccineum]